MRSLVAILFFPLIINGQFFNKESNFVYGINFGTHLANDSASSLYNGYYNSSYNINNILFPTIPTPLSNYLDDELGPSNWGPENVPPIMKYRPGLELGLHLGLQKQKIKIYLDYNFIEIKAIGEFNIVQNFNSNNNLIKENILASLIGEERRSIINLGIISNLISENEYHIGFPIFVQVNQSKVKSNYMVIDNQVYNIPNPALQLINNQNNSSLSGFGLGTGLVGSMSISQDIIISLAYNLQYSKIKLTQLDEFKAIQNSIILRIIWNKK